MFTALKSLAQVEKLAKGQQKPAPVPSFMHVPSQVVGSVKLHDAKDRFLRVE